MRVIFKYYDNFMIIYNNYYKIVSTTECRKNIRSFDWYYNVNK